MASDGRKRIDEVRRRQQGVENLDEAAVAAALYEMLDAHQAHPWHQVGRCVFCGPCNVRLYQGTVPADHPRWVKPFDRSKDPASRMLDRWGKS